jgi:hypothetical protein
VGRINFSGHELSLVQLVMGYDLLDFGRPESEAKKQILIAAGKYKRLPFLIYLNAVPFPHD